MGTNPATLADVTEGFERPLSDLEERAASRWLTEAWRILNRDVPGVSARLDLATDAEGHLSADDVVDVLTAMVRRVLRNPDGTRSWSDDTHSETIHTVLASGELYVTDREKERLAVVASTLGGVYTMQLGR
jgi:hypothetical protein